MSKRVRTYVGLARPYRFERAIIVVLALVVATAVLAAVGWLAATDALTSFGPRTHYLFYVLGLLVLAIALVRRPWLAGALLILAVIDFGWGVGSYALRHQVVGATSLLPPDKAEPERFRWHALLQTVPVPAMRFTSATGLTISHTSKGTHGKDPVDGLAGRTVVATFGGSTTYDIGAA